MSAESQVLCDGTFIGEAQQIVYTSTGCKSIIDLATLTNTGDTAVVVQLHIVRKGDAPLDVNKVGIDVSIAPKRTVAPIGLNGARLEADGFVSVVSSAADKVTIRLQGRQFFPQ